MYKSNGSVEIELQVHKTDYEKVLDILDRAFIFHNSNTDEEKENGVISAYIAEGVDTNHFEYYVVERLYNDLKNIGSVNILSFKAEIVEEYVDKVYVKTYKARNGKLEKTKG